ncbi:MAG: DnaA ATPase domain-containing protein, partial [Phycisphaerales bacterium]
MARLESSFKQGLLDYLRRHHADMCRHWFDEIEPLDIEGGVVRMLVREPVQLKYLQRCCVRQFTEAAQQVSGRLLALRFVGPEEEFTAAPAPEPAVDHEGLPRFEEQMLLSPDYTFDNFVVGPGNRLAHAAAIAVADKPGRAYNPYFIHGGVGLGKTHLLQAITQTILRNNRSARICYISCGTFTDAFHDSVKAGRMNEFRHRFRNVDVLVIDDIHFLSKREQSQEEFFHTFNALYQAGRQVVLSSDAAPQDIPDLEERLTSRFNCGLVARIDRPCFETRVAILRGKARMLGLELPDDVPAYIAARIDS